LVLETPGLAILADFFSTGFGHHDQAVEVSLCCGGIAKAALKD
jgi:hypothetical protein